MENSRNIFFGFLIGVGATLAVRDVYPALAPLARPAAKQSLKLLILGYEHSREFMAEFAENVSDVLAEVQAELNERQE